MSRTEWTVIFVIAILLFSFCSVKSGLLTQTSAKVINTTLITNVPAGSLVVPDKYPTIQAAIGNASLGDTVFVKKGTYNLTLLNIDKPLSLIGENSKDTIINGYLNNSFLKYGGLETILISASKVTISGFTITNSPDIAIGINSKSYASFVSGIKIIGNNIINNGIAVSDATGKHDDSDLLISRNNISNSQAGIAISSTNSVITGNIISRNYLGISVNEAENLTITDNNIVDNSFGLSLSEVSNINIYGNNINGNIGYDKYENEYGYGIEFAWNCNDSAVHDNNIQGNINGVSLQNFPLIGTTPSIRTPQGSGNMVYNNNLVNNSMQNANVEHQLPYNVTLILNGTTIVSWDNGAIGNYWSDYKSKYPNATEVDASGIGNIPYVIDENNTDHYPLMQQVNITTGEPGTPAPGVSLLTIATVALVAALIVVISLLIYIRNRAKKK